MQRPVCWWLSFGLGSFLAGRAEAPSPVEPPERSRPYAVLRGQNLEREAGPMPGARRGTRSRDSRITPWAKGRRQTAEPPRDPLLFPIYSGYPPLAKCVLSVDGNHFQHPAGDCDPYGILCLQAHSASVTAKQTSSSKVLEKRSIVLHVGHWRSWNQNSATWKSDHFSLDSW